MAALQLPMVMMNRTPPNYRSHAMRYLFMWLDKERGCCRAVQDASMEGAWRLEQLQRAAVHFAVARNLPRTKAPTSPSLGHYQPLLDVLDSLDRSTLDSDYANSVAQVETAIRRVYPAKRRLPSLASKCLWLKFQQGFVIYDSRVRAALGCKEGVCLSVYLGRWQSRFQQDEAAIGDACEDLATVLRFAPNDCGASEAELRSTLASRWFHERVLDMVLWSGGGRG